ncbi:MAG: DUF5011 domain-containing protein [Oliverpabstia sp.]|nr:DUF5011 domain-containing protein [Oliverpabstia sp.]
MKKKQVLAVSSALMIGTTTALTGLPTPVMAQENTEVVQEAVVEENKTEQVPVEQETENADVQENITDKEQEEITPDKEPAENTETSKEDLTEESAKQETPATPEKEVVTEDKTVVENKNTEVKAGNVAIDEVHFPDAEFRKYMSDMWDTDHDGELSEEERKKAERLIIYDNPALKSLKGIEYFPNIWQIDCHSTGLTELDLSKNEKLSWLWCGNTAIESLEIRNNPKLDTLICRGCENLETLIIENTPLLEALDCQNTNIADLDVSNFPVLNTLACSNTKITTLDVTHNPALRFFECQENNLDTLDISQNPRLFNLDCDNNNLKVLDISNNPEIALLSCRNNKLSTLDVSKQTHLNSLSCEDNLLTTLDITNNTELKTLICNNNFIKELDITQNSKLQWLKCDSNPIKQLDTTNAPYLNKLQVNYTALTQLDISKNTELASLEVCNTNIAGLDVSNNSNLEYLAYIDNGKYFPTWLNIGNKSNLDLDINSLIEREINLTDNTFDLRKNTDSKIDLSKVTITSNGTLDKNTGIVTVKDTSKDVSYKYDCGTNNGEHVFLNVTFKLNDDIPTNTPPTISANDITLNVGDTFDPLKDVTATDKEDGTITLTKDNIIANDVDTSKAGTYHVTYKVTDKNGASTEKTITVIVKQNTGDLNTAPTISANDVTLNVGDTFDPLANVTATDKEDGTITLTKDNIIANDVDTSKAGTYHVTYKVTDKNGASTEKTITVIVKQNTGDLNTAPTISANDVTLNVGDTFDPLANVTATDKEDGTIALTKDNIIANDVDTSKAGTYHVTYKVTDKNGASTEKTITVTVKEKTTNKPISPQQPQKPNKPTTSTKPSGQKNPVKTGDVTNVGLFASMFASSTGALAVLFGKKRKRNKND